MKNKHLNKIHCKTQLDKTRTEIKGIRTTTRRLVCTLIGLRDQLEKNKMSNEVSEVNAYVNKLQEIIKQLEDV